MITFKNFLSENSKEIYDEDMLMHMAAWIARDCKPYLEKSEMIPLYRGMKLTDPSGSGNGVSLARVSHPQDRPPKDSPSLFNDIFNRSIEAKLGIPGIRRRTIFASGDRNQASQYGKVFFFFPIGDFEYAFAQDVVDSYEEMQDLWVSVTNAISGHIQEFAKLAPVSVEEKKFMGDAFDGYHPFGWMVEPFAMKRVFASLADDGLQSLPDENAPDDFFRQLALHVRNRIDADYRHFEAGESLSDFTVKLIACLKAFWPLMRKLIINNFTAKYEFNDNLPQAIRSHVEILFYSTKGYYVVEVQKLRAAYVEHMTKDGDEEGNTGSDHKHYFDHRGIEDADLYEWFIEQGRTNGKAD